MVIRSALVVAILLILMGSGTTVGAVAGVHAKQVAHGLRFEIGVARRTYPRDALVQVTASVRNISARSILLRKTCGYGYLWVEVVDRRGQILYPPAIPAAPPPTCSGPTATAVLRPGGTMQRSLVVLLRGARLRVVGSLASGRTSGAAVTLRLVRGTPPTVTAPTTGPYQATITPAGPVRGPLYVATFTNCYRGISNVLTVLPTDRTEWNRIAGRVVTPAPCASDVYGTVSWQLVAGWIGRPAVIWQSG